MHSRSRALAAATLIGLAASPAPSLAAELFQVTGTVTDTALPGTPTQTFRLDLSSAIDVTEFTEIQEFQSVVPFYRDDVSAINATVLFRGLPINVSFAQGSRNLQMSVPLLGETRTFVGFDRDDALEQLQDFFLSNTGSFQTRFLQALVRLSPNDPVAGNPNSLQSRMASADFATAGFDAGSTTPVDRSDNDNKFFWGVSGGTFRSQSIDGKTFSLPLSYTARFDADPRYQLSFALPITYMDHSGAKTGSLNLATGFQFPLTSAEAENQWYLTPRLSVGATGSEDMGSAAILGSASLTSRYVHRVNDRWSFTLANMVAYSKSVEFEYEDIGSDYGLKNTIFKNGLQLERRLDFALFGGRQTSVQASYAFTNFTGTELFMNRYHEVALSVGAVGGGAGSSILRVGLNGQFGDEFRQVTLGFGYSF